MLDNVRAELPGWRFNCMWGHSLAPPTHLGDASLPSHFTQTGQQQGKPSLAEVTQHRFPWAEKQAPHTLSYLTLLCLFPLFSILPFLVPSQSWKHSGGQCPTRSARAPGDRGHLPLPTASTAQSVSSYKHPLPTEMLFPRTSVFYFSNTNHERMFYSRTHNFPSLWPSRLSCLSSDFQNCRCVTSPHHFRFLLAPIHFTSL